MKLWRIDYTRTDQWGSKRCVDFWWSTSPITISTPQHYWDVIFPGNYTISEFTCSLAPEGMTEEEAHRLAFS